MKYNDIAYDVPVKPFIRQLRLPCIAEIIRQEPASMA